MSLPGPESGATRPGEERGWLYHHIGRLSGGLLFLIAFGVVAFLAAIGYGPALGLLLVIVAGFLIITIGGHMRGGRAVPTYRDEGIVLRTIRLGEADRIVTLLTREHGKVRAVAKGVRKTKSRMGARVEPLTHAALLCWKGRELDVVTQAEVIDSFRPIRESLALLTPALTVLEIVDQLSLADLESEALFAMVIGALRALERTGSPLVLGAFCFKLLALEGLGPAPDRCACCGDPGPLVAFDPDEGGFLCRGCRRGQAVSAEVVDLAQRVMSGQLARLLEEAPATAVGELERLGVSAIEHHLNRRLRSSHQLLDGDRLGA